MLATHNIEAAEPRENTRPPTEETALVIPNTDRPLTPVTLSQALLETIKSGTAISFAQSIPPIAGFLNAAFVFSKLGTNALAANTLIGPLSSTATIVLSAQIYHLPSPIARALEQNNHDEIWHLLRHSVVIAVVWGTVSAAILHNAGPILRLFGQESAIVDVAADYFKYYIYGVPAYFINVAVQQYANGVKNYWLPVGVTILGQAIAVGAAFALAFGIDAIHLPALGVSGIGLACSIGSGVSLAANCLYLALKTDVFKIMDPRKWWNGEMAMRLQMKGAQMSAAVLVEYGVTLTAMLLVGHQGIPSLTAQQVVAQYQSLLYVPIFGFALASSRNIGGSLARRFHAEIRHYAASGVLISTSFIALFWLFSSLFPETFANLFIQAEHELRDVVIRILGQGGLFNLTGAALTVDTIRNVVFMCLLEITGPYVTTGINLAAILFAGVGSAVLFDKVLGWGILGINGGIGLGMLVGASAICPYLLYSTTESKIKALDAPAPETEETQASQATQESASTPLRSSAGTSHSFFSSVSRAWNKLFGCCRRGAAAEEDYSTKPPEERKEYHAINRGRSMSTSSLASVTHSSH